MNCNGSDCNSCKIAGIFASVLLAFAIGVLSFFGVFENLIIGYIAALVLGFLSAVGVIAGMSVRRGESETFNCCLCRNASELLTGAIGSVLLSLAGILIGTGLGTVISALLAGFTAFFFFLLVSAIVCFAICLIQTCD